MNRLRYQNDAAICSRVCGWDDEIFQPIDPLNKNLTRQVFAGDVLTRRIGTQSVGKPG